MEQPAAEGNAVGLVVELLRIDLIEWVEFDFFQNLRVQRCNAVDAEAIVNVQTCHVHSVVLVDDAELLLAVLPANLVVQHFDDGNQLRNYLLEIGQRPLLQRLCQNGVVGVSAGLGNCLNGIVHFHTACNHKADQFRNHHCGVCVVDLDHCIVRQIG